MYKKVVAALAMIFAMLFVSIGAFAASPAVQEVEALISQIGTVTRENRSAVESAVNAYNQLDEASKAAVSNYAVLAEAQQVLGIKDALAKLGVEYDKVQNSAAMRSPYSDKMKSLEHAYLRRCFVYMKNMISRFCLPSLNILGKSIWEWIVLS